MDGVDFGYVPEKMVLHERQVDFLQKEREKLYNEAIQEQKIKFYEN